MCRRRSSPLLEHVTLSCAIACKVSSPSRPDSQRKGNRQSTVTTSAQAGARRFRDSDLVDIVVRQVCGTDCPGIASLVARDCFTQFPCRAENIESV